MKTFIWIICMLAMLTGAIISAICAYRNYELYKGGRDNFAEHIIKLKQKGYSHETALEYVIFQKKNALLRAISETTYIFVFVYIAIDILFKHIF